MRRFVYIFILLAVVSCARGEDPVTRDDVITFSVSAPGLELTRAEVKDDGEWELERRVKASEVGIRLHEALLSDFIYGLRLVPDEKANGDFTGRWFPEVYLGENRPKWTSKTPQNSNAIPAMSFFAFAFSPFSQYGSSILVGEGSRGRTVTITQPSSYVGSDFIDYLLSYEFYVDPQKVGDSYPVVDLQLEHAMTKVELYVDCSEVFKNSDKYRILFTDLSFNNINTKGTLTVSHHRKYKENGTNLWAVTYDEGSAYVNNYKKVPDPAEPVRLDLSGAGDGAVKFMEFIAFPAKSTFSYTLSVAYRIEEDLDGDGVWMQMSSASATYALKDYTDKGWLSGHKVRYSLHIDNGIELSGKISDWVEVDYVEGVIIPDLE